MQLRFIDLQHLYNSTEIGKDFILALHKCPNMEFYSNEVVQMIIDHQWAYWKPRSVWILGFPLTLQLILFLYWSNIVLPNRDKGSSFET
mmetsp:Transcript_22986/g.28526  ORF Transcript_22986/g.28526 Transcript_22986/m.28526 type:complete len:89 (-) Transcript_22986:976-1242(-)